MRLLRRISLVVAVPAGMLALSGCVVIDSLTASQQNVVGNVRIVTTMCASGSTGCADKGNSNQNAITVDSQVLLAYRIPTGVGAPATLDSSSGGTLHFTRSASFDSELQRLAPAPAGQIWVGYISDSAAYNTASGPQTSTVQADFSLPQGSDGSPYVGPFSYRTVLGVRTSAGGTGPTRAVTCGDSLADGDTSSANYYTPDGTICGDSPAAGDIPSNLSRTTRDLGVIAPADISAPPGATAQPIFTLKYRGTSTASANFAISASTTVPGASATPSQGSLAPATDSDNPVFVNVPIPAGTPAGTYDVTLTALVSGQSRTRTAHVVVNPAAPPPPPVTDKTPPTLTLVFGKTPKIASLRARGYSFTAGLSEPGSLKSELRVSTRTKRKYHLSSTLIGSKTSTFSTAGARKVTVKLTTKAKAKLKNASTFSATLKTTAKDKAGNKKVRSKSLTFKRR